MFDEKYVKCIVYMLSHCESVVNLKKDPALPPIYVYNSSQICIWREIFNKYMNKLFKLVYPNIINKSDGYNFYFKSISLHINH